MIFLSDPAGILTQDLQNRNLTLYSAKLRSQHMCAYAKKSVQRYKKEFNFTTKDVKNV